MEYKEATKYWFLILVLGALYVSFLLVQGFITTLISSMVLAFVVYPIYLFIKKKVKIDVVASLITTTLVILVIIIPFAMLVNVVANESYTIYSLYVGGNTSVTEVLSKDCTENTKLCENFNIIKDKVINPDTQIYITEIIKKAVSYLVLTSSKFILSIPEKILNIFVMFFSLYYFLKNGSEIVKFIKHLLPLRQEHQERVIENLQSKVKGILYGYIIIALIQGIIAGIGYFIFGVENPIVWTIMTIIASIIPFFGTGIIWVPLSVFMMTQSLLNGTPLWKGVGLFIYGAAIISTIDNIVRPKIMGDVSKTHPLLVFLGVIGGLKLFGFMGFVIGPIILVLTISLLEIYAQEK